jgi:hypothetical protein
MSLAGATFLALWNDVARAREPEYDRWHVQEHVPERVAVRGINGARRYVNRARDTHRYFTLYEVDSLAAFDSAEYQDLLRRPTPWSAAMRPDFENFVRAPFRVDRSEGAGIGAALAVLGYERSATPNTDDVVSAVMAQPAVVAAHSGSGGVDNATADWRAAAPASPARAFDAILLVETLDRAAAAHALAHARRMLALTHVPADFASDVYDFVYAFPGHTPQARARYRRAHWDAQPD